MKVFIIAVLIFSCMTGAMFLNIGYLNQTLEGMRKDLASIPYPIGGSKDLSLQEAHLTKLEDKWKKQSAFISLTVNHADLMEVETQFAAARGAAGAGTRENYLVSVSQLDYALSHLIEMAQATPKNII